LQVFDFIKADFAILMVFEFFLMTAEVTEIRILDQELLLCVLSACAVSHTKTLNDLRPQ